MKEELAKLKNKKIVMLGLGSENVALMKYLIKKKIKCSISVEDSRTKQQLGKRYEALKRHRNVSWSLGPGRGENLTGYDVIFRSPGWPVFDENIREAIKYGVKLNSAIRLFFDLCPTNNIIGISGTKGKGTTSALITQMLKKGGKTVWFGGNIGVPVFPFLDKIKKNHWVVLELSSFQLEDMQKSPYIAVFTNFYSEHLTAADPNNPNYHMSLREYWRSKVNMLRYQKRSDYAVINRRLKGKNLDMCKAKKVYFDKSDLPTSLPGRHNKENIAAAVNVAEIVGISREIIGKAVRGFKGLEHRIEKVAKINGIEFYDDSFATLPDATKTALRAFRQPIILIAGGADKGSSFISLARMIAKKVKFVVLLHGEATKRFRQELIKAGFASSRMRYASGMDEAVGMAIGKAREGEVILLSPACASFGMFKNYKERGNKFKRAVNRHKKRQSHR